MAAVAVAVGGSVADLTLYYLLVSLFMLEYRKSKENNEVLIWNGISSRIWRLISSSFSSTIVYRSQMLSTTESFDMYVSLSVCNLRVVMFFV